MQGTDLAKEGRAWRLLVDTPAGGAYNMAVDEAILLSHARGEVPPTLRLYQWNPPAVSAGFSQDILKKIDLEKCRELGIDVVRRPTGGRAVLHDKEITYSVTIALSLLPGSILETYRFISRGLVEAVNLLGLKAEIEDRPEKSRNHGSAACFDSPSWYEIEVSGRKLVGSAQTRQKGVLLQHGSVLLELDTARMQQVLSAPNEKVRRRIASALEERATAVNPELVRMGKEPVQPDAVEQALIEGFSRGLGITLTPSALTEKERILAEHLVKTKYSAPNWNFYRKGVGQHV